MSTLQRFLRYSLAHQRPIKVLLMPGQSPASLNLTVQAIDDEGISYLSARNKKTPRRLSFEDLLSAGYARGDDGSTDRPPKEKKD